MTGQSPEASSPLYTSLLNCIEPCPSDSEADPLALYFLVLCDLYNVKSNKCRDDHFVIESVTGDARRGGEVQEGKKINSE